MAAPCNGSRPQLGSQLASFRRRRTIPREGLVSNARHTPSLTAALAMGWNTATDGSGNTYYWNEKGESTYEKPADFDEATAPPPRPPTRYAPTIGGNA